MPTTTPTRVEDVKDPIGITGWPKEKGRDGERTPMQWNSAAQSGFSTDSKTWLPIPASYKSINVQTETAQPDSLLNWHKRLIHLRRDVPALHDGEVVMLDTTNTSVLSYLRKTPSGTGSVVVSLNMTSQPQTISLDLGTAGVKTTSVSTILTSDPAKASVSSLKNLTLPPFSAWVGKVK
jgi:alpha-glucosidase